MTPEGSDACVVGLPVIARDGFVQSLVVALIGGVGISDIDVPISIAAA